MRSPTDRRALALLIAASLVLAAVDHLLPKPIPFIRLGLANLPILVALRLFGLRDVVVLGLFKIVGQGVVTGMLFSYVFVFSAAGTSAAVLMMLLIDRGFGARVSLVGVSVCGAFASNLAQLACAALLVFGRGALVLAPPILISGLITAILLGLLANRFVSHSRWIVRLLELRRTESGDGPATVHVRL